MPQYLFSATKSGVIPRLAKRAEGPLYCNIDHLVKVDGQSEAAVLSLRKPHRFRVEEEGVYS